MEMTANSSRLFHVVAIPYPGRGHINPMLNLCHHLATADHLTVTVVVTEDWFSLLSPSTTTNLRFACIRNVLPLERDRGADPFGFVEAVRTRMGPTTEELLRRLQPPAEAIVADSFLPWVEGLSQRIKVPATALFTQSASMFLAANQLSGSGEAGNREEYLPKPRDKLTQFRKDISWSANSAFALIFNSCYDLEKDAVDALRSKFVRPVYPLAISIPSIIVSETSNEDYYFRWLDSKPRSSVLYISLGSFLSVSASQMDALACGIRDAGVRFLWIVREEAQSQRIAELAGGKGLVLRWCNQVGVLRHASVGGFLTHCGWNSALEGAFAGVPMLTFPIFWDQFPNSKIVVDDWKVGMRLKKIDATGVSEDEISMAVAEFMDLNAENSKEMRRRAAELKDKCRRSVDHGGSSSINLEAFAQDLLHLKEQ